MRDLVQMKISELDHLVIFSAAITVKDHLVRDLQGGPEKKPWFVWWPKKKNPIWMVARKKKPIPKSGFFFWADEFCKNWVKFMGSEKKNDFCQIVLKAYRNRFETHSNNILKLAKFMGPEKYPQF